MISQCTQCCAMTENAYVAPGEFQIALVGEEGPRNLADYLPSSLTQNNILRTGTQSGILDGRSMQTSHATV